MEFFFIFLVRTFHVNLKFIINPYLIQWNVNMQISLFAKWTFFSFYEAHLLMKSFSIGFYCYSGSFIHFLLILWQLKLYLWNQGVSKGERVQNIYLFGKNLQFARVFSVHTKIFEPPPPLKIFLTCPCMELKGIPV